MQPDEIVRKILEGRGIVSENDVSEFLSKKPKLTYDPFLIPGMDKGADFVLDKLSSGERICVYGDYDADGICGTALLILFLRETALALGSISEITFYLPSRTGEGFGLNSDALKTIKENGADTVITVDCGSLGDNEVAYAKEIGLDILITDHHDFDPARLPDCIVINPKIKAEGGGYPFDMLSGTGVAFKLCAAVLDRVYASAESSEQLRKCLHSLVDLVCVATIADVMPLTDENRTFVKYGLMMLRKGTRQAFKELFSVSGISFEQANVRDIAFGISPRINALGRLGDATDGVELLLTNDEKSVRELALHMNALNDKRRAIQDECLVKCLKLYEEDLDADGKPRHLFLLLRPFGCYEGVAGIVAGKMQEDTGLPCAVLSESHDNKELLKGSARSGAGLNIIGLLKEYNEMFERYGGHAAAAGFTILEKNENLLREKLSEGVEKRLVSEPDLLKEKAEAEAEISPGDVTPELAYALAELAPFGNGNPKPLILLRAPAESISGIRFLGQDGKHIKFSANGINCIYFNGADTVFPDKGTVSIFGFPEINVWNGRSDIQFAVERIEMV